MLARYLVFVALACGARCALAQPADLQGLLDATGTEAAKRIESSPGLWTAEAIRGMGELANAASRAGDSAKALRAADLAIAMADRGGDARVRIVRRRELSAISARVGDLRRAEVRAREAIEILRQGGLDDEYAPTYQALGEVLRLQGKAAEAMEPVSEGLRWAISQGQKIDEARIRNTLAGLYNQAGRRREALEQYQRSLELAEAGGEKLGAAFLRNNIGTLLEAQGDLDLAERYYKESLAAKREVGTVSDQISTLGNLALLLFHRNRVDEAERAYRDVLELCDRLKSASCRASNLSNLSLVLARRKRFAEAKAMLEEALPLSNPVEALQLRIEIGGMLAEQGQIAEARAAFLETVNASDELSAWEPQWRARVDLANTERLLGDFEVAEKHAREAVGLIERGLADVGGGGSQTDSFLEHHHLAYRVLVEALLDRSDDPSKRAEALGVADQAKARWLLDLLGSAGEKVSKGMRPDEREAEQNLRDSVSRANLAFLREQARPNRDAARVVQTKKDREDAASALEAFEVRLYASHPRLQSERSRVPPADLPTIQASLKADEAVLEFAERALTFGVFVITRDRVSFVDEELPKDKVATAADALQRNLAERSLAFHGRAKELYQATFARIESLLRGKKSLVVVPDGALWQVPFAALEDGSGRFVAERFAVSYVPSLAVYQELIRRSTRSAPGLFALGNPKLPAIAKDHPPLPSAEIEASRIGALFAPRDRDVRIGERATEAAFKKDAGSRGVVHLATHGVLNAASPLDSELLLAPGDGEDGLLSAREIMELDLKADLVTLSACEMANGKIGSGEGIVGMSWAMFVAGVPSTVANLWKADSAASSELMVRFHTELRAGKTKAEALRLAMVSLMKRPEFRHPFYWAGFELVGRS